MLEAGSQSQRRTLLCLLEVAAFELLPSAPQPSPTVNNPRQPALSLADGHHPHRSCRIGLISGHALLFWQAQMSLNISCLQFVSHDLVVGVVADQSKCRKLLSWRVGQTFCNTIDQRGAGEKYKVLRPANSTFFAFTVTPANMLKPTVCGMVDLDTAVLLREVLTSPASCTPGGK